MQFCILLLGNGLVCTNGDTYYNIQRCQTKIHDVYSDVMVCQLSFVQYLVCNYENVKSVRQRTRLKQKIEQKRRGHHKTLQYIQQYFEFFLLFVSHSVKQCMT